MFDGLDAVTTEFVSSTTLIATTPAHTPGTVWVGILAAPPDYRNAWIDAAKSISRWVSGCFETLQGRMCISLFARATAASRKVLGRTSVPGMAAILRSIGGLGEPGGSRGGRCAATARSSRALSEAAQVR